jgi:glycerol-3-phosphate dehydrogenase
MTADAADAPDLECDVLVVGGGINGTGIARDLAGRGFRVVLAEQHDLASHTSSSSTKLIHGGLRYLEYGEFLLVRKALAERERLLRSAPHLMKPLRFVMPHDPHMRPVWMIRLGLFLYDHLARRELLPGSGAVDLREHPVGRPLQPRYTRGFVYSDGWVDDARLVVACAQDAAMHGAQVFTRCRVERAQRTPTGWEARLHDERAGERRARARALVNAAGPWAAQFLHERAGIAQGAGLRLVKGSHIVVPRRFEHEHAYIFQNPDGRIVFAIPYEQAFTLIGTTDVEHHGAPGEARIDADEIAYLCEQASRYFREAVTPADVVWTYSGVRPLLDDHAADAKAVTRDYKLELDRAGAPLLNVWGGKITTFRKLAEEAADALCEALGRRRPAWTGDALLPGGDFESVIGAPERPDADLLRLVAVLKRRHPERTPGVIERWARAYGVRAAWLLDQDPGAEIAPGLYEVELQHLREREWACSADDVLWRRSKLGLHFSAAQREAVERWWAAA